MFPDDMFFIFLSIEGWARELETIMNELGKWANRWKSARLQKTKAQ
jgi:hypothetical protein